MAKQIYFEDVAIGTEMPKLVKSPLQKLNHVIYAGASGDFNPLHTDDDFAKAVGMKDGMITHGMLVMGFVGQAVTNWIPKKNLKRFGVRFAGMTKPGNTITVTGKVIDKKSQGGMNLITCEVTAVDETGDVKVTGSFDAALPTKG
jgi:acyl dehydratase